MRKLLMISATLLATSLGVLADTAQERLRDAADMFNEVMATPDKGIPQDLFDKAACVILVPGMKKGAFIVGGQYGKGFAVCRTTADGGWGAPAAVRVEGGSVGFQIGGSSTDVVMLVMNEAGMRKLNKDKFTLGADASIAAGPVGRTAAAGTDANMSAEILSWSRSKGLFAGIALNGATLRPDMDDNKELYGQRLNSKEILMTSMAPPEAARVLIDVLAKYSNRKESTRHGG